LEQAYECWTKQSLITNPFANFRVKWAGERKRTDFEPVEGEERQVELMPLLPRRENEHVPA
jgi:hypothetical protein